MKEKLLMLGGGGGSGKYGKIERVVEGRGKGIILRKKLILVIKFFKVELLVVFWKQLSKKEAIGEIRFEVRDFLRKLDFIIQPAVKQIAHLLLFS